MSLDGMRNFMNVVFDQLTGFNSWYCQRCNRSFRTEASLNQHNEMSADHYTCSKCDFDGEGWYELIDHCRTTEHKWTCVGCDDGIGELYEPESDEWYDHVKQ